MKSMMVFLIILIVWIIFAQSCMTFRKTDEEMKKGLRKKVFCLKQCRKK